MRARAHTRTIKTQHKKTHEQTNKQTDLKKTKTKQRKQKSHQSKTKKLPMFIYLFIFCLLLLIFFFFSFRDELHLFGRTPVPILRRRRRPPREGGAEYLGHGGDSRGHALPVETTPRPGRLLQGLPERGSARVHPLLLSRRHQEVFHGREKLYE